MAEQKVTVTGDMEVTGEMKGNSHANMVTQSSSPKTPAAGRLVSWFRVISGRPRMVITNESGTDTDLTDLVGDETPQLGGNLDVNGYSITSASNNDIPVTPNGTGSVRLGSGISPSSNSSVYYASGNFSTDGDAMGSTHILRGQTTDATLTQLFIDGSSARLTLPTDSTWTVSGWVTARRTDANDESAGYKFEGVIDNNGGTVAVVGMSTSVLFEDTAAWNVNVNADDANNSLRIQVTGEAAKNINWVAMVHVVQTIG